MSEQMTAVERLESLLNEKDRELADLEARLAERDFGRSSRAKRCVHAHGHDSWSRHSGCGPRRGRQTREPHRGAQHDERLRGDQIRAKAWLAEGGYDELSTKTAFERHAKSLADAFAQSRIAAQDRVAELEEQAKSSEAQGIRFMRALEAIAHGALNPASVARNTLAIMDANRPDGFEYPSPSDPHMHTLRLIISEEATYECGVCGATFEDAEGRVAKLDAAVGRVTAATEKLFAAVNTHEHRTDVGPDEKSAGQCEAPGCSELRVICLRFCKEHQRLETTGYRVELEGSRTPQEQEAAKAYDKPARGIDRNHAALDLADEQVRGIAEDRYDCSGSQLKALANEVLRRRFSAVANDKETARFTKRVASLEEAACDIAPLVESVRAIFVQHYPDGTKRDPAYEHARSTMAALVRASLDLERARAGS